MSLIRRHPAATIACLLAVAFGLACPVSALPKSIPAPTCNPGDQACICSLYGPGSQPFCPSTK